MSGSATCRSVEDPAADCLPGPRPDWEREERLAAGFFSNGESDDGGLPELEESLRSSAFRCSIRT